ncbi:hypothetical protein SFSGTM_26870 [Sulfuriferula nivalis]|uniref:Uncharacterized protein n=1 Tax=Sulfuriferula nivalis TaxID=2675298 RepID=A0A809RJ79_9PROT|nr:hypothetical protein SFSGTM_26870 [Sulfuriferula nivalis]
MGVGAVNVVSSWYSNQNSIAGGDEIMLRNLMVREYFSAIAASFNPAFEQDSPKTGEPLNFTLRGSTLRWTE